MSRGMCLTAKVKRITSGPQAGSWGIEIGDPRLDGDRPALATARMTSNGKRLRWLPWSDGVSDQPLTVALSQFYFGDP